MRLCISVTGRVRPSVHPSVRPSIHPSVTLFLNARKRVYSTIETARDCAWQREVIRSDDGGREGGNKWEGDKGRGKWKDNEGDESDGRVSGHQVPIAALKNWWHIQIQHDMHYQSLCFHTVWGCSEIFVVDIPLKNPWFLRPNSNA